MPYYILALPKEQLKALPDVLGQLTAEEAAELITLLERQAVSAKETGPWVADMLEEVLEEYSAWLAVLLCAVLLCGCRRAEPEQSRQAEEPPKTEQTALSPEQTEPEGRALAEDCAAVYRTVTKDLTFLISVEGADGSAAALDMTPLNAAEAAGREGQFTTEFQWSEADKEDWLSQAGNLVTLADGDSQVRIQCRTEGDVICWRTSGATTYARVTGADQLFSRLLLDLAEDEMERRVWAQTVSGTFAPAGKMAEAVAEGYRNLPDWVSWKPLDMKPERVELYDTYEGTPRQLCCNLFFRVQAEDPASLDAGLWNEAGDHLWSTTVRLEQDRNGAWRVAERNIGGVFVVLPFDWETATLEQLTEAFFRSGGETNRRRIPDRLLELPEEELARLPDLLAQCSEMEVKLLCGALGNRVKEGGSQWTMETLQPVMSAFDIYLDA